MLLKNSGRDKAVVRILSYASTGELSVLIRGERYTYYGVSWFWYENFRKWIDHCRYGMVLQKLKCFSNAERYEELKGAKRCG